MTTVNFLLLATICFVAMVSPGPDFVLVTRSALVSSRRHALATALGIISGCLVHATYCVLGLAFVITKSVLLFSVIKYAGACYLVYVGARALFAKAGAAAAPAARCRMSAGVLQSYLQGLACNLLNPKLALFLLSLFTQFISPDATVREKFLVASVFVIESALYWPALVLVLQHRRVQAVFEGARLYLDRACGALLLLLGLRVAFSRD